MNRRSFLALPLVARAASSVLYKRIHSALEKTSIIDTHEHYPSEAIRLKNPPDFFALVGHYTINDLISAGLPREDAALLGDRNATTAKKWSAFEPYWKSVRNTGYGQALSIAVREVYGIEEISSAAVAKIDDAIARHNKPGIYREIIRNKSNVRFAVNDAVVAEADAELLKPSRRFDHIIDLRDLKLAERLMNVSIGSLADLKRGLAAHVEAATRQGMVAIKLALAYQRDLTFADVPEAEAASEFERKPGRRTVDHLVHYLLQLADEHRVTVQVHTGMLSSNGSDPEPTRPTQLVNLLKKFPRARFDLFHTGYPYHHEFTVLVKQFPNAYGNFCWTHTISPSAARQILREMLDAVPANKILGFGGDYRYPELSHGHLVMARRNIATVLAERVEAGTDTEEQAAAMGRWMLHDNAARLFERKTG